MAGFIFVDCAAHPAHMIGIQFDGFDDTLARVALYRPVDDYYYSIVITTRFQHCRHTSFLHTYICKFLESTKSMHALCYNII